MKDKQRFTLDELSTLADVPVRTARYYIQMGLLAKPLGAGRGAHYDQTHLEQLLQVKKWSEAGLSLERIGELLSGNDDMVVPPARGRKPGDVEVWSHLHVSDGLEIHIEPSRASLSPEQVRAFSRKVMALYEEMKDTGDQDNEDGSDDK